MMYRKLLYFFGIDLLLRLALLFIVDNSFLGDAGARLEDAIIISDSFEFFPSQMWLPLPTWVQALSIITFGDIIMAPRVPSAIFTSLTIIPLFFISKKLFNKKVAYFSLILYSTSLSVLYISTLTLSEPYYLFWGILGVSLFLNSEHSSLYWYKPLLSVSIILSCLTRFEAWPLSLVIVLLFFFKREYKLGIMTLVSCVIALATWEFGTYHFTEKIFNGILESDSEVSLILKHHNISFSDRLSYGLLGFSHFSFFVGIPIAIYMLIKKKNSSYMLLLLVMIILVGHKVLMGTLNPEFRYNIFQVVLLLPVISHTIYYLSGRLFKKKLGKHLFIISFLFLSIGSSFVYFNKLFPLLYFPNFQKGFINSIEWAKSNLTKKDHIFLDKNYKYDQTLWWLYSGRRKEEISCMVEPRPWIHEPFSEQYFKDCLETNNPIYLVLFPFGELSQILKKNNKLLKNYKKEIVFKENFEIIRVSK